MHMCYGRGVTPQAPFSCERQGVTLFASLKCSGRRSEWSGWASSARTLGKFCSLCSSSLFRCSKASHGLRVHLSFGLQALGLGLALLSAQAKEEAAALPPHPKKGPQRRALASDASDLLPPLKRQRMESPAVPVRPPPEAPRRIPAEPVGPPPSRLRRPPKNPAAGLFQFDETSREAPWAVRG